MGEVQGPFAFCGRPVHTQSVSLSKEEDELAFRGITAYDLDEETGFQAGQVNTEKGISGDIRTLATEFVTSPEKIIMSILRRLPRI